MIGKLEQKLITTDRKKSVIGVDEVGRGCLAGPVYSACVSLNYHLLHDLDTKEKKLIRDSKSLSKKQREHATSVIKSIATEWQIGIASVPEIEKWGIVPATFKAAERAIKKCQQHYDILLYDGNTPLPFYHRPQLTIVKGDSSCYCIAAASILAKVARDHYMTKQSQQYPTYDFEKNAGYGTKTHLANLYAKGPCPLHRKNFAPVKNMSSVFFQKDSR